MKRHFRVGDVVKIKSDIDTLLRNRDTFSNERKCEFIKFAFKYKNEELEIKRVDFLRDGVYRIYVNLDYPFTVGEDELELVTPNDVNYLTVIDIDGRETFINLYNLLYIKKYNSKEVNCRYGSYFLYLAGGNVITVTENVVKDILENHLYNNYMKRVDDIYFTECVYFNMDNVCSYYIKKGDDYNDDKYVFYFNDGEGIHFGKRKQ